MLEPVKSKRVISPKGGQKRFLDSVQSSLGITQLELAKLAGISLRSFTDWRREKVSLPFSTAKLFTKRSGVRLGTRVKIVDPYWYTSKGGSAAAKVVLQKYGRIGGNVTVWRKKWLDWWKKKGRFQEFSPVGNTKPSKKPKNNEALAEFIGIVLGDGGISKTQVNITLHSMDDKPYSHYVERLIKRLFEVTVGRHKQKNALAETMYISRSELVQWLEKNHGLKAGSKVRQQADVPVWIKNNLTYSKACARGLMDTDGCVFLHTYIAKGKSYTYKKITFTNFSKPLVYFVYQTFSRLGLHPRFGYRDGEEREVRLDGSSDMKKYFDLIGTHNPKFLKRWRE